MSESYEAAVGAQSCNATASLSTQQNYVLLVIRASGGCAAVVLCTVAAILVLVRKFYGQLVYRLALYQVLSSLLFSTLQVLQLIFLNYRKDPDQYRPWCLAIAFLHLYSMWMKLCFTAWVTCHLFCFAMYSRNMKRLEPVYIVTSLLLPAPICAIPFITGSYGLLESWCGIVGSKDGCPYFEGIIQQFFLWYVPAFVVLLVESVAMVAMMVTVLCFVLQKKINSSGIQALKQMLSLAAYPLAFFALIVVPFATRVYGAAQNAPNYGLLVVTALCIPGYGITAGLTLLLHVVCVITSSRRKRVDLHRYGAVAQDDDLITIRNETVVSASSNTKCVQPSESDMF